MLLGGQMVMHVGDMQGDAEGMLRLCAEQAADLLGGTLRGGAGRGLKDAEYMGQVLAAQIQAAAKLRECDGADRAGLFAVGGDVVDRRAGVHAAFYRFRGLEVLQGGLQECLPGRPDVGFDESEQVMVFPFAHQNRVFIVDQAEETPGEHHAQYGAGIVFRALNLVQKCFEIVPRSVAFDQAVAKVLEQ